MSQSTATSKGSGPMHGTHAEMSAAELRSHSICAAGSQGLTWSTAPPPPLATSTMARATAVVTASARPSPSSLVSPAAALNAASLLSQGRPCKGFCSGGSCCRLHGALHAAQSVSPQALAMPAAAASCSSQSAAAYMVGSTMLAIVPDFSLADGSLCAPLQVRQAAP